MPNEAYDFSLFEVHMDNTVPAPRPERRRPLPKENITALPQKELEKNAKPKRHPVRMMAAAACFLVGITIAAAMVYSQQQLSVLTEQINAATHELDEMQSMEVQLSMQAALKMNGSEVENYAAEKLGMGKITSGQVTYVNVAQDDRGTVIQSVDGGSVIDKFLSAVRSFFARS